MKRSQIAVAATGLLLVIGGISANKLVSASTIAPQYTLAQAPERHPELRAALRALKQARTHLQKADHDFEGRRQAALNHTNEAIKELEAALAADKH
jgi:hypothetical protein